jgi:hypothetical protein
MTFDDVPPSNFFYGFIGVSGAKGIWAGCGGGNYCPGNAVRRDEMARILVGNYNLAAPMDHSKLLDGNNLTHPRSCRWQL